MGWKTRKIRACAGGSGKSSRNRARLFFRVFRWFHVSSRSIPKMSSQPALEPQSIVVRSPDQVSGDLDGKVVLLSIENGEYYNMNEVGSRIWALLEKPMAVSELIDRLLSEFEIDRPTCENETAAFLEQLQKDRLLKVEPSRP